MEMLIINIKQQTLLKTTACFPLLDSWKDGRVFRREVYHMSMDSKNQPIVKLITEKTSGNVNIINMKSFYVLAQIDVMLIYPSHI